MRVMVVMAIVDMVLMVDVMLVVVVISGREPTCDMRAYGVWSVSAAPLGDQARRPCTMTLYPTQSHYPGTEPLSLFPILIMPSTWLGSDTSICNALV